MMTSVPVIMRPVSVAIDIAIGERATAGTLTTGQMGQAAGEGSDPEKRVRGDSGFPNRNIVITYAIVHEFARVHIIRSA